MPARFPAAAAALVALWLLSAASSQTPPSPAGPSTPTPAVHSPTSTTPEPGVPRTRDGRPDLQGEVWATNFFPVFESTPLATTLVVSEEEAKKMFDTMVAGMMKSINFQIDPEAHEIIGGSLGLPIVRGERRSRLVVLPVDGKVPMTPEARKLVAGVDPLDGERDDYEQRPTGERCLVLGAPPAHAIVSYNRFRFIQTATHLVIHTENGDEARIIPFAVEHKPVATSPWYGDAIARWESDTLVVETIRQTKGSAVRGLASKFIVGENSKVIERFTRLSKNELLYQFTVEDPKIYTAPWLAEYSFYSTDTGMFPSPCHEHNYSLPNILLGARVADAKPSAVVKK